MVRNMYSTSNGELEGGKGKGDLEDGTAGNTPRGPRGIMHHSQ